MMSIRSKYLLIILLSFVFSIIFFVEKSYAYPYCSNGICVTGYVPPSSPLCYTGCTPDCPDDCPYGGSCAWSSIRRCYYQNNCCFTSGSSGGYTYGGSCDEDCDCTNSCPTCGTCTPTCPSGSATSPVTSYPVTASCSNGSGCPNSTRTCYYQRQDLCTSSSISSQWIKSGQSSVITANATTNVNSFIYVFYNRDRLISGIPQPICRTYDATWAPNQGSCPAGSYQMTVNHTFSSARSTDTLTIPANSVFVRDITNGNLYVDNIQVNVYFMISGRPISLPDGNCVEYLNHCTPLCTPVCGPTYATSAQYSSSGVYLGSMPMSCNNTPAACGTESRTCYCYDCINSCPAPLSNTSVSLPPLPNLILDDFRQCTTACAVPRAEDCYERPSAQPTESLRILNDAANDYDFSSMTHSGIPLGGMTGNLNDPINMRAVYTDANGASDIEGIFVWFRDSATTGEAGTPLYLSTTATPQAPSNASWGFMMRRTGPTTWVPYVPSYAVNPAVWVRTIPNASGEFFIASTSGQNMVGVTMSSPITSSGNNVTMNFRLRFSGTDIINPSVSQITYRVLLMGLDTFSFTPNDNYESVAAIRDRIDSYWAPNQLRYRTTPTPAQLYARAWVNPNNPATGTNATWTIDKVPPTISFTGGTPTASGNNVNISWSASDIKNLYAIVGNIYTTAGADARDITLSTSTPGVILKTPNPFTPTAENNANTGRIEGDWSFRVAPNMNTTSNAGLISINVGANRTGTLTIYITAFDDAGNMATAIGSYNLNDWFVTDGGLGYSAEGTSFVAKPTTTSWSGKLPPFPVSGWTESLTNTKADLSSEMWAERITQLDNNDFVDSYALNGHGGYSVTNNYQTLWEAFQENKATIPSLDENPMSISVITAQAHTGVYCANNREYCVLEFPGSLEIRERFRCNDKTLIFVNGTLTINPPLWNLNPNDNRASNENGCVYVVRGNLIIKEGRAVSGASMVYDVNHGYFIVDGTVLVEHEVSKPSTAIFDGVYINGGIHAGGGVTIKRYLRLIDRLSYPVLAIDHHPKYGVLGGVFFGNNFSLQKVEPGFKP